MGQVELTPYLQKLEEIKKKAQVLGAEDEYGKAVMHYLYKIGPKISNILQGSGDGVRYQSARAALDNPGYSKYVTSISGLFSGDALYSLSLSERQELDLSRFDFSSVQSMREAFKMSPWKTVDFGEQDLSHVTDMSSMFYKSISLERVDMRKCKFGSPCTMEMAFLGCDSLLHLLTRPSATINVTNMSRTFEDCTSLHSYNLSRMDLHNLETMHAAFNGCTNLDAVLTERANLSALKKLDFAFNRCYNLRGVDMRQTNLQSLDDTTFMFGGCEKLILAGFTGVRWGSNSIQTKNMFDGCISLKKVQGDPPKKEFSRELNKELRKRSMRD